MNESGNAVEYPLFYGVSSVNLQKVYDASSGGVFFEIAKYIIKNNGVVYGAIQESPLKVKHSRATNFEEISLMRKSKYLHSSLKGVFEQVENDLELGKLVLFSGIGCQLAALKNHLNGKDVTNLILCDVVCHGMPISESWNKYISEKEQSINAKIKQLVFREKRYGWLNNCIREVYDNGYEDINLSSIHPVHELYLKGINMELGCVTCKFQNLNRISDITLADFWKADDSYWEDYLRTGVSLVAVNNEKGQKIFEKIIKDCCVQEVDSKVALDSCKHMSHAPVGNKNQKAFVKLIKEYSFDIVYKLFSQFGEIVLPEKLAIFDFESEEKIIDLFLEDTHEVAYITNGDAIKCVVTFDQFVKNYVEGKPYINGNFNYVVFDNDCVEKIKEIFDENLKINRVPIVDKNHKILFEVRRKDNDYGKNDNRKIQLVIAELKKRNQKTIFVHRPDSVDGIQNTVLQQIRMRKRYSFPVMMQDFEKYKEHFEDIFEERENLKEHVDKLADVSPIVYWNNRYVHANSDNEEVTVINERRVTVNNPCEYIGEIHIYGRCGVFGYAVSNNQTMPSYLQKRINDNNKKYRVNNNGLWGADDEKIFKNLFADIRSQKIGLNDIVVIYMRIPRWAIEEIDASSYLSMNDYFKLPLPKEVNFYDKMGHMNAAGYKIVADAIYEKIENIGWPEIKVRESQKKINISKRYEYPQEIKKYFEQMNDIMPKDLDKYTKIGAIVMNCNPFTKGHKYLIDFARKQVDYLIIFVVEEDKSIFPFKMRYEMVCEGTKEYENVSVVPSGNYIISSLTFPEYFTKEKNNQITINPTYDVEVFGKYIAKEYGITTRFVGTEPKDWVTYQYNEVMKQELPKYCISLVEIPRLEIKDNPISATEVRKAITKQDYDTISKLLPDSTINVLKKYKLL